MKFGNFFEIKLHVLSNAGIPHITHIPKVINEHKIPKLYPLIIPIIHILSILMWKLNHLYQNITNIPITAPNELESVVVINEHIEG